MAPKRPSGTGKRRGPKKAATQPAKKSRTREPKHKVVKQDTKKRLSQAQHQSRPSQASTGSRKSLVRTHGTTDAEQDEIHAVAEGPTTARKYKYLEQGKKRIPIEKIEDWPDMSQPVLDQIHPLLQRAKNTIVLTRRDGRKADEADETLHSLIQGLMRYLSTARMPPDAKALHFDLDRMIENNARIYAEVTTARHAKQLLEEQIEIATVRLQEERKFVETLEKNKEQWSRRWKSQEKKRTHPLLQQSEDVSGVSDKPGDIGLKRTTMIDTAILDTPDAALEKLLQQLRRSLETMQGNHAQVQGINEAVKNAQVALDDVLSKHIGAQQYNAL